MRDPLVESGAASLLLGLAGSQGPAGPGGHHWAVRARLCVTAAQREPHGHPLLPGPVLVDGPACGEPLWNQESADSVCRWRGAASSQEDGGSSRIGQEPGSRKVG